MPIYRLDKSLWFPPPSEYEENESIIAIEGGLEPERLLLAYGMGIFPWYNEDDPVYWWSPVKRMVMNPADVKISKSSRNLINRKKFTIKADQDFKAVIDYCQQIKREDQNGTWLNDELKASIIELHKRGFAHSIEAYEQGKLVGGLYGISIGKIFFGDSMFSLVSNASKMAFIHLAKSLADLEFELIDCQVYTPHMEKLGAREISRADFLKIIQDNDPSETIQGSWSAYFEN